MPDPLSGLRVLDFSRQTAGGAATRILANYGAEVLRVEWPEPPGLDFVRLLYPADGEVGLNRGGMFNGLNVDKRSVTLNMSTSGGRDLAARLVEISDVVYDNMTPGVMARWGLDFAALQRLRPDVIYVSCSGFGHTGPRAAYRSYGGPSAAHTGIGHLAGLPGRPPAGWGFAYADYTAAWANAVAILMALERRRRTGRGVFVDSAQTQSTVTHLGEFFLRYGVNGMRSRDPSFPPGNRRIAPCVAPHGAYPCAGDDTWCVIAVYTDDEWAALKEAMGCPAWADQAELDHTAGRFANQAALDEALGAWTRGYDRYELVAALQARGVAAGVVQGGTDRLQRDPQLAHRGTFAVYDHPETGPRRHETVAARLRGAPYRPTRAAPLLGQDNDFVLRGLLGLSDADLARLGAEDAVRW